MQRVNPAPGTTRTAAPYIPPGDPAHPWSEKREQWLNRRMAAALAAYLLTVIFGFILCSAAHGAEIAVVGMIVLILAETMMASRLEKMRTNKPANPTALDWEWFQHPPTSQRVLCGCGRILSWTPREFIHDEAGGRQSMICPCGKAHFKIVQDSK